jgi:large subunit ribosomal protein L10
MARAEKVAAVAELTERFQNSAGAVLTEYRGLSVAQLRELRGTLGEAATFTVVKNTLTKIAVEQAGLENELAPLLTGPSAVAFVTGDVVETAKGLRDFAKANPFLVIKGGVLDGKALTPAEITTLADLEPREVLLAKLAGAMKATTARAAGAFAALPVQMAQLTEALRVRREAEEGSPEPATAPAETSTADSSTDGSTDGSSPQDSSPQDSSPQDSSPQDSSPQDSSPEDSSPQDSSTDEGSPDAGGPDEG